MKSNRTSSATKPGTKTRRHPQVSPHVLALLHRAQRGDRDAFADLYRQHLSAVTRYVATRLGGRDRDGVDDCVHDAFCDALADPTLIGADVLGSLLRLAARAVTRRGWSQRRYVRAAYAVYADNTGGPAGGRPATAPATTTARRLRLRHALARLSDEQRRIVQLRYFDGHARAAVAALMDRSVDAVRTLERQAVTHLKADLGADGFGYLDAATSASVGVPGITGQQPKTIHAPSR